MTLIHPTQPQNNHGGFRVFFWYFHFFCAGPAPIFNSRSWLTIYLRHNLAASFLFFAWFSPFDRLLGFFELPCRPLATSQTPTGYLTPFRNALRSRPTFFPPLMFFLFLRNSGFAPSLKNAILNPEGSSRRSAWSFFFVLYPAGYFQVPE